MRTNQSPGRLEAFHTCGAGCTVQRKPGTDEVRLAASCCHDRFCTPCQTARAAKIRRNLARLVKDGFTRMITLTLRHSKTTLASQIDRLYRSFATLRRSPLWKDNTKAGAAFIEVKIGERDGLWHVHLHVLHQGDWIDQHALSRRWHEITGDSSIVDVRQVASADHAATYVTKYVTKPADSTVFNDPERLDEFLISIKGRRLYNPFGAWKGKELERDPDDDATWVNVQSLASLMHDVDLLNAGAIALARLLGRKYPTLAAWFKHACGLPPPETSG